MTEERRAPETEEAPRENRQVPAGEPTDDPTATASTGSRERNPRITLSCDGWGHDFEVSLPDMFEPWLLLKLDTGGETILEIHEDGESVRAFHVDPRTAAQIFLRLEDGPRLPPAVHWRWMHGSPAFEELRGALSGIYGRHDHPRPALEGAGAVG